MPKQMIEVDVPDGFEVDTNLEIVEIDIDDDVTGVILRVPLRRKLSYERKPELCGCVVVPDESRSPSSPEVTRLLRHVGIVQPPTADEVEDLVRCTLDSLGRQKWVDIVDSLAKISKKQYDWQWPEWLKAKWLVQVESGEWFGADTEPVLHQLYGSAYWSASGMRNWQRLASRFIGPPCTDWRQSKRRNPNWIDST